MASNNIMFQQSFVKIDQLIRILTGEYADTQRQHDEYIRILLFFSLRNKTMLKRKYEVSLRSVHESYFVLERHLL